MCVSYLLIINTFFDTGTLYKRPLRNALLIDGLWTLWRFDPGTASIAPLEDWRLWSLDCFEKTRKGFICFQKYCWIDFTYYWKPNFSISPLVRRSIGRVVGQSVAISLKGGERVHFLDNMYCSASEKEEREKERERERVCVWERERKGARNEREREKERVDIHVCVCARYMSDVC